MILHYYEPAAYEAGVKRHPTSIIRELAEELGFTVLRSLGSALGDCFFFEIDRVIPISSFPAYISICNSPPDEVFL